MRLIFSFLHIRSLLIPCAYVSIESIDCILLSSLELKAILLISSVRALCFTLLNLCFFLNISLLFFMNSFWSSLRISTSISYFSKWFILLSIWDASKQFLQTWNLSFLFMAHFFVPFAFLSLSLNLLNSCMFLLLIQQILSWFFRLIHLSLIQLLFYLFL